jgi:EpsI family protein
MLFLFWLGSFWQERRSNLETGIVIGEATQPATSPNGRFYAASVATILAASIWQPLDSLVKQNIVTEPPALLSIAGANGWVQSPSRIATWKPHYGGFATELDQTFRKGRHEVGLYIAFYRNQTKGNELITSTNLLTPRDNWEWKQIGTGVGQMPWNHGVTEVDRAELWGRSDKLDVYRWYWIAGHVTSSDIFAKILLAISRLTGQGDDSALVVTYMRKGPPGGDSSEAMRAFAEAMSPSIEQALVATRASGR